MKVEIKKIANFIKKRRKELGMTQVELADKLFVTEKAVSRWETGRGTPDISLLIPLSKVLGVSVSELLNGEESKSDRIVEKVIEYSEVSQKNKYGLGFKFTVMCYIVSILLFLIYLRFEYDPNIELNYFMRLFMVVIASLLIIFGNIIYGNYYVDKIEDKNKIAKFSMSIVFIYYVILLFNMVIFARYDSVYGYNLVPFKSILEALKSDDLYFMVINIFGNLVVFMPLEYFIINLFEIKRFSLNFILSFLIILIIEILQFVFKIGVFDIDDILLSFFGMMMFYVIYNYVRKFK